ncbi:hypothetical protein VFPPC_18399 [Pochonia chlamydosporia 170]|uniref:Uncharacterized protein n=1 Tax=Pochonia chlamydosporia 170 TaxID=1380566 RepID=A0A219ANT5_METCM|nr:hypothetical protein VFPPC_18399 [Pochonia chlamydosporia 170]OWT42486.1 hypothetical protein VFPPC_18399 [Pochonia chlamydosporia 170]
MCKTGSLNSASSAEGVHQNQNHEEEPRIRLLQLSEQAIEKQNSVNQLTTLHRQTQQETQRLDEERQRLGSAVDELTVNKSQLMEEEQAKAVSLAAAESEGFYLLCKEAVSWLSLM